ncbi:hypothetical protein J7K56_04350 [Candidatus Calescamantes bacterium]|nr:hypothetical protein [Candidatus Calescamantes bacterium]
MIKKQHLFFLGFILLYFFSLTPLFYTGGDNAHYLILARSLAEGKGYRIISHPESPPETTYPPLFPLLLAPLVKIWGFNPWPGKILVICFGLSSFWVMRKIFPSSPLPFLLLLNPLFLHYSGVILTEIPFTFFTLLTIFFFKGKKWGMGIFLLLLSLLTRWIGITLWLSITLVTLLQKEKKNLPLLFLPFSFFIYWFIRGRIIEPSSGYLSSFLLVNPYDPFSGNINFQGFVKRIVWNGGAYILRDLPATLFPSFFSSISIEYFQPFFLFKMLLGLVLSLIIFRGWWISFREKKDVLTLYFPIYFLPLLIWPWKGSRFLLPLLPLILLFTLKGARKIGKGFYFLFLLFLILANITQDIKQIVKKERDYPPYWKTYFLAGEWIKKHTCENTIICTRNPYLFFIFSNRKSISFPLAKPQDFKHHMEKIGVDYLVLPSPLPGMKKEEDVLSRFVYPFLNAFPENLKLERTIGKPPTFIYKVIK